MPGGTWSTELKRPEKRKPGYREFERNMGNTDSKTLSVGPAGQRLPALNNSPSYMVQDFFHLFKLNGGTSIKFILIILTVALIALAVKLGLRKRKGALTGHHFMTPTNGDMISNLTLTETSITTTSSPVLNPQQRWVDQQAMDLHLIEHQRMFQMMFLVSYVNTFVFRLELIYFTVESSYVTY